MTGPVPASAPVARGCIVRSVKIETFALERWMTAWETKTPFDIAESGVYPMTLRELLAFEPAEERELVDVVCW